ncbi:MAG: tRNA lysidine(34) synthetase TilS [Oscillospiraceae bacterium]|nr:tRNA lysidine(34) synthetase TilS [Oscillospiraceae bacterium]
MILNIIKKTLTEYNLIDKGDRILIGLSGGADSVCLTHALHSLADELGIRIYAAHLNHGIRGDEAERDEIFAKRFAEKLGIECFTDKADIPAISTEYGISEETAGRKIRYEFFYKLCEQYNITKIATAHNKNDNAETILMNFMRGSTIAGLCGIPVRRSCIIRPLLDVTRAEIENYCRENNLEYVTDSTNLTDSYTRNKIRHTLIPLITEEFNSNFINTVSDNASLIKDDSDYLDNEALIKYKELVKDGKISIDDLSDEPPPISRRIIRHMLKSIYGGLNDVSSGYIRDILALIKKQSGTEIHLFGGVTARCEYGMLIIEKDRKGIEPFNCGVAFNTPTQIREIGKIVTVTTAHKRVSDGAVYISCDENDKIIIRSRKEGDKFYPSGMTGSKKIKDYLINEKIPKEKRNSIPVIEVNGIIAAVGNRVDRNFLFRDSGVRIEFIDSLSVHDKD